MNRKNNISSVQKLPAIGSASSSAACVNEDILKGAVKGRHRSVANAKAVNASYTGRKGPALANKMDMSS